MSKHLTPLFLCFFFGFVAQAQISLSSGDFPSIGQTLFTVNAEVNSSISIGSPGANQTYDFSSLVPEDTTATTFVDPATTPGGSAFPGANLATGFDEEGYIYIQKTSSEALLLGSYVDTSENNTGAFIVLPFDPVQKFAEFPTTFNTSYTSTWGITFSDVDDSSPADSLRFTTTTLDEVLFDGYGTVITPDGSFNGLRSRTYSTSTVVTEALFLGTWTEVFTSTSKDTSYAWYAKESRGALVNIEILDGEITSVSYTIASGVTSPPAPVSSFSFVDQGGGVVDFTDGSSNTPTGWSWDFGDGNTSTMQNPQHTYTAPGTYTVCLTASNAGGSNSSCQSVTIVLAPVASFTFTDQGGGVVDFNDGSTNSPSTWSWDFGDGNTSSMQNPQHTFAAPGTFQVCLTASNSAGMNTSCQSVTIVLAPVAAFTFTDQGGGVVDFKDESTNNPETWMWEFGDGNTSTDQNPQYTFTASGVFNVCLTSGNSAGSNKVCQDVDVMLTSVARIDHLIDLTIAPNPVKDRLQIHLATDEFKLLNFSLVNSLGQVVLEEQLQTNQNHSFDLKHLAKGVYYYSIRNQVGHLGNRGSILKID